MGEAWLVATPLIALVSGSYGKVMHRGPWGYVSGAVAGILWSLLAWFVAARLDATQAAAILSADLSLGACVLATGLLAGSGIYVLVSLSVLREPSTTYAVLSAMMRPTVPFYISINSAMELLFLPLVLFLNWNAGPARRWIIVAACVIYAAQRVWTYAVYAERRLTTATQPLSEADVAWYRQSIATDYRAIINVAVFVLFTVAAVVFGGSR